MRYVLRVNGRSAMVEADAQTPLLTVLQNDLGLTGPKFGCGLGQCGACTVLLDGVAVRACVTAVARVGAKAVTTVEGLGTPERLHPLQQAFVDTQAAQCGYCISGMVMSAKALLDRNPRPSEADIRQALAGNLCRCCTYLEILAAVRRAATGAAVAETTVIHGGREA
jgi:nicotinate dehydrogenase subunit A